ncbi:MAG TPA: A/G-specific adenine glycosylase [Fimbriimonadales bacterium]|nr:A/G-specific adenine glycosylase [Fimbriimonadales bacterium]
MQEDLKDIRRKILRWYRKNERELPWRKTKDPYRIWISEVMLQQTRVSAVIPYFEKFIERFPTLKELSKASIEDVYRVWQGLGYYKRARNLLETAKTCSTSLPANKKELERLPGIGNYTASAIASIAYGERCAVVDGNVMRVLSRVFCLKVNGVKLQRKCEELSLSLMGKSEPGRWNQALMELGSEVCQPKNPKCEICPIHEECSALRKNVVLRFPPKKNKKEKKILHHVCVCSVWNRKIGVRRIPRDNWWEGLYEFPKTTKTSSESDGDILRKLGCKKGIFLISLPHTITNHKIFLNAYLTFERLPDVSYITPRGLMNLPMPSAYRRVATSLLESLDLSGRKK